jgi:hypothetical protein
MRVTFQRNENLAVQIWCLAVDAEAEAPLYPFLESIHVVVLGAIRREGHVSRPQRSRIGKPPFVHVAVRALDGLRAHDRHLIAAFRSAHCHC